MTAPAPDWRDELGGNVAAMRGQLEAIAARNGRPVPSIVGRHMDEVQPEAVRWLWPGRIPLGKLGILEGEPGLGKSTLALNLAARVTRGAAMPDGTPTSAGGVVILTAEDGLGDTVRPRLEAAGADLGRAFALEAVRGAGDDTDQPVVLPAHIEGIRAAVDEVGALLVIIDPLAAYLDGSVNSWRDHDVRRALHPLARLSEELGIAMLVIRHLRKSGAARAVHGGLGSIGITGAARSVLLAAQDPDDESRRVLAVVKSNLAREAPSLTYHLEPAPSGVARIIWGGESPHRADQLVSAPADQDERSTLDEAVEWLRDQLTDGPQPVRQVIRTARADGISDRTLVRARQRLGVRSVPTGYQGPRVLTLPDPQSVPASASLRHANTMAQTGDVGTDCGSETPSDAERQALQGGA